MRTISQIQKSLHDTFLGNQIVCWEDKGGVYQHLVAEICLEGVELIDVGNAPFKARLELRKLGSATKALIYRHAEQSSEGDWLLDVKSYAASFSPDSLEVVGVGLPEQARTLVERYPAFFQSDERKESLQIASAGRQLSVDELGTLMVFLSAKLPVATSDAVDLAGLIFDPTKWAALSRNLESLGIEELFWMEIQRNFGYSVEEKSREDFLFEIFSRILESATKPGLTRGALRTSQDAAAKSLMSQLRGKNVDLWERVVADVELEMGIDSTLSAVPTDVLLGVDFFPSVDRILSYRISEEATTTSPDLGLIRRVVDSRLKIPTAKLFQHDYLLAQSAAELSAGIRQVDVYCPNFEQGVANYSNTLWKFDYWYRHAVHAYKKLSRPTPLQVMLYENSENLYCNSFLRPLADSWQISIDIVNTWHDQKSTMFTHHKDFYQRHVVPETNVNLTRTAVVISDAFRYEVGKEFQDRVTARGKFSASTTPLIAPIPSYTKLGMASLLPNTELSLKSDASADVLVDGKPSGSTEYRSRILEQVGGTAITSETVLGDAALKATLKDFNLVYVYHNRIDAVGDKALTELQTFEAVEATFLELMDIVEKLEKAGFPLIFVTADHGFIYQNNELTPIDYLSEEAEGEETPFQNRRFIIGSGLVEGQGFKKFTSHQLGLTSNHEFLIPKSIRRLRRKGSGARFVHGGATLQEIVVPLVRLTARNARRVIPVDFQVVAESKLITTAEPAFRIIQSQAVSNDRSVLELRVSLICDGEIVSEQKTILLNSTDEEIRNRYMLISLALLPKAQRFVDREIDLVFESKIMNTQRYKFVSKETFKLVKIVEQDF